ncbi:tRNA lysidine(34) synthetase TilS [Pantoea rodasii]|uniref:tRNA(Ile)-lysidine synthase n=1 Tax=Pantoea rodasii TaxID=1076549 RepID=A0A2M9W5S1_9GAMM|nr:tRNA lysidine(34) synthetase TilS [Pantoea rodasii]ORM64164.1 tRNA lysidine(34) synthetase TilS [Pantoea rodasii]PJZ02844.1 tRNA lysidine(34) synthetase TilS [Pantoea rodasii]
MSFSHLASLLTPDARCVLAFSGGLDSSVLLHQLVSWQRQLPQLRVRALHVHHGLSPNADSWASHCLQTCQQWQIPCEVLRVQVDGHAKGIEAAAREARYQALFQQLQPGEHLLTAQHLDDQCETLLLALKRGSGPAGLAAMPIQRQVGEYSHLRPLLGLSRQQLEAYAAEYRLRWIEDESNADSRYDRNFLRQQILPLLQARWPHFSAASARSAALCGEQEQLLDELLAEQLAQLTDEQGALHFPPLLGMSEARRHALLRRWIAQQGGAMPSREALKRITDEVMQSREDANPSLIFAACTLRRYRQQLFWLKPQPSLSQHSLTWHDRKQLLRLPDDLGTLQANPAIATLRQPTEDESINVCFQASGYHYLLGRAGGREMKKLWQELGVPPWQRERIPLIYYNQTLICAPGLFITREGAASDEQGWQALWLQQQ